MSLFGKELKNVTRGVLYIVFVGAVVLFYATQFSTVSKEIKHADDAVYDFRYELIKPLPGHDDYGTIRLEIPEVVMPNVVNRLLMEWGAGSYTTYPLGFYKSVRTNDAEQQQISDIIMRVTGHDAEELFMLYSEWQQKNLVRTEDGGYAMMADASLADITPIIVGYDDFKNEMSAVDEILGGGSSYDPDGFIQFGSVPRSYEQALADYETIIYKDKISGAYARLFCDYMGIAVALFAVFVPVGYMLRDRKADMQQLVFSRRCSSAKLVCTRYFACLAAVLLPIVLLGLIPAVQLGIFAAGRGLPYAPFAFLLYTLGWIMPTAMVACSVGFFFTVLTGTPIGIAVQFIWGFVDLSSPGPGLLYGAKTGARLIPRHNMTGGYYLVDWEGLIVNRIGYTVFALVLLAFTVLFYELQRRGKLDVQGCFSKIFRRGKNAVPSNTAA